MLSPPAPICQVVVRDKSPAFAGRDPAPVEKSAAAQYNRQNQKMFLWIILSIMDKDVHKGPQAHSGPGAQSAAGIPIDPRLAITAVAVVVAVALFVLSSLEAMAAVFVYLVVWYFTAGGRMSSLLAHGKRLIFFVIIITVLNGVLVPGKTLFAVAGRPVFSAEGIAAGVFFSARLIALYFSMVVLLVAAPAEKFANGIFGLCKPLSGRAARRLAFHGFLAMSFLPLFSREYDRIRAAQSFRGAGFHGGFLRRLTSARLLLVPLILSAVHRSGQLAAVVELRGLQDRMGASMAPARFAAADFLFVLITLGVLALSVFVLNGPGRT